MFHRWVWRMTGKNVSAQRSRGYRPQFEPLEDRWLLSFLPAVNYPNGTGDLSTTVAIGDLTGNGISDIVLNNEPGDYRVSVLLGNGDGTFQPAVNYVTGEGPGVIQIADVNGDGIPDLITANFDPGIGITGDGGPETVSVLLGNGDGTFQHKRDAFVGHRPGGLVVADLTGDGIPDIVTTNRFDNSVSVLVGNGDGTFRAPVTYPVGFNPVAIAAGRFGGDSDLPDLAVVNNDSGTVSVLVNYGDGTFRRHVDYPVGSQPFGIALGDFAHTGNLDIAVANFESNTVNVLMGNGDHTFQPARNTAVPGGPADLVAADFNNDGNLDLAVAVEGGSNHRVSVLLGDGTGNFASPLDFDTGLGPLGIAAADLNHDGFADLVTANFPGRSASILLNDGSWDTAPRGIQTSVDTVARSAPDQALALAALPAGDRQGSTPGVFTADLGQPLDATPARPVDGAAAAPQAGTAFHPTTPAPALPTNAHRDLGAPDLLESDPGILDRLWGAVGLADDPHAQQLR
jgi:hypothetical protein